MEVRGRIIEVLPAQSGTSQRTGNAWQRQEYVLETFEQYPHKIPFYVFGAERINNFNIQSGEIVTISFSIEGAEYQGRWYVKINAYNVTRDGDAQTSSQNVAQGAQPVQSMRPKEPQPAPQPQQSEKQESEQLPF